MHSASPLGGHLGQAVFQHVAMKIQRIFRRFRVSARLRGALLVARVRKLVALAFILSASGSKDRAHSSQQPRLLALVRKVRRVWEDFGSSRTRDGPLSDPYLKTLALCEFARTRRSRYGIGRAPRVLLSAGTASGDLNAELSHPGVKRRPLHSQLYGSATWSRDHPVGSLERLNDVLTLRLVEHRLHVCSEASSGCRRLSPSIR